MKMGQTMLVAILVSGAGISVIVSFRRIIRKISGNVYREERDLKESRWKVF